MKVDGLSDQFCKNVIFIHPLRNLVRSVGVLAHDEEQGTLATVFPFIEAPRLTFIDQAQMRLVAVGAIIMRMFDQLACATDDRRLDNPGIHRFAKRRVADDLEDPTLVVLRRCREIELRASSLSTITR